MSGMTTMLKLGVIALCVLASEAENQRRPRARRSADGTGQECPDTGTDRDVLLDILNEIRQIKVLVTNGIGKEPCNTSLCNKPGEKCPDGFERQPDSDNCYKLVTESHTWDESRTRCAEIGSHLAVIEDAAANDFVVGYLKTFNNQDTQPCSPGPQFTHLSFLTSGQRLVPGDCQSTFVWKPKTDVTIPMNYTNWFQGEPSCGSTRESCLQLALQEGLPYTWNDTPCSWLGCPICHTAIESKNVN